MPADFVCPAADAKPCMCIMRRCRCYTCFLDPADVNYIWNVAAAVKRFDREVEERRAEASAAAPAGAESAGGSGGAVDGRSMPYRLRR